MTTPLFIFLVPQVGAQNHGALCKAYRVGVRVDNAVGKSRSFELRVAAVDHADLHRQLGKELARRKAKSGRIVALIEDRAVTELSINIVDAELQRCRRKEPVTP